MSQRRDAGGAGALRPNAPLFAALADETRLRLIGKLCRGEPQSISELSRGSRMTRQAITKHLRVLEEASLVHGARQGRKMMFEFTPAPIEGAKQYLDLVSNLWDETMGRLKSFVESSG